MMEMLYLKKRSNTSMVSKRFLLGELTADPGSFSPPEPLAHHRNGRRSSDGTEPSAHQSKYHRCVHTRFEVVLP